MSRRCPRKRSYGRRSKRRSYRTRRHYTTCRRLCRSYKPRNVTKCPAGSDFKIKTRNGRSYLGCSSEFDQYKQALKQQGYRLTGSQLSKLAKVALDFKKRGLEVPFDMSGGSQFSLDYDPNNPLNYGPSDRPAGVYDPNNPLNYGPADRPAGVYDPNNPLNYGPADRPAGVYDPNNPENYGPADRPAGVYDPNNPENYGPLNVYGPLNRPAGRQQYEDEELPLGGRVNPNPRKYEDLSSISIDRPVGLPPRSRPQVVGLPPRSRPQVVGLQPIPGLSPNWNDEYREGYVM